MSGTSESRRCSPLRRRRLPTSTGSRPTLRRTASGSKVVGAEVLNQDFCEVRPPVPGVEPRGLAGRRLDLGRRYPGGYVDLSSMPRRDESTYDPDRWAAAGTSAWALLSATRPAGSWT